MDGVRVDGVHMSADWLTLLWLFAYALAVVGLAELAVRRWSWAAEWGRKAIHVGVGVLPFAIVIGMEDRCLALLAPASFVLLNWISQRLRLSRAMDAVGRASLGTVYYPLSLLILLVLLWDTPARPLAAVAMLPMITGDAAAAIAGKLWGKRTATLTVVPGLPKTLAGSLAMIVVSWLSLWAGLAWAGDAAGPGLATADPLALSTAARTVALAVTAVELVSPAGTDNLTVPLTSIGLLWSLGYGSGHSTTLQLGLILALAVALLAHEARALTTSGAAGAVLVGGLIFGLGGWRWALVLLAFFISSSALSRLGGFRRAAAGSQTVPADGSTSRPDPAAQYAAKGSRRDLRQVLANGGIPMLAAVLWAIGVGDWCVPLFLGSMAAATADTWATEIGTTRGGRPHLITSWRPVTPGTSGGVTAAGLLASLAGATLISILGTMALSGSHFGASPPASGGASFAAVMVWPLALATVAGGIAGSLVDSVLGATLQSVRFCPACSVETERLQHRCGERTVHHRGLPWLDNDAVNFIATTVGGLTSVLLSLL